MRRSVSFIRPSLSRGCVCAGSAAVIADQTRPFITSWLRTHTQVRRASTEPQRAASRQARPTQAKAMLTVVGAVHDITQGYVTLNGPNKALSPSRSSPGSIAGSLASRIPSSGVVDTQEAVLQFTVTTNILGEEAPAALAAPATDTAATETFVPPTALNPTAFREACIRKEQFVVRCFGDEEDLAALKLCLLDGSVVRVRGAFRLNRQDKELASLPAGAVPGSQAAPNPAARPGLYGRRTGSAANTTSTAAASASQPPPTETSDSASEMSFLKKVLGLQEGAILDNSSTVFLTPQVAAVGGEDMRYYPYVHVQLPSSKAVEKEEGAALRPLGELSVLHRRP